MELGEFERRVEEKAPPHLKGGLFVKAGVLEVAKENNALYPGLIPEALSRADKASNRYVLPATDEGSRAALDPIAPTPTDFLAGERLVEKLSPLVRDLREKVFGHGEAPFENLADAADWIEQTSSADLDVWRETGEERGRARKKIEKLAREHRIEIEDKKQTVLTYQRPDDGHVKVAHAVPNTRLHKLAEETKRIASRAGLPEDAFVMHVLTGLKPMPSRVRIKSTESAIRLPDGEQVCSRWVEVKIFARDLVDKELRKVYGAIRESIGSKGDKGLNGEDRDFWELMQEMGAPPEKDKGKFWEEALRRWKALHPDSGITGRDGVKRKYERLSERLDSPR